MLLPTCLLISSLYYRSVDAADFDDTALHVFFDKTHIDVEDNNVLFDDSSSNIESMPYASKTTRSSELWNNSDCCVFLTNYKFVVTNTN